ncbi:MAG: hypothetical protein C0625_13145 [Arcobacter sp.]|nr:MAG: hypothetical protein C0625_13145 [Arcobacter sp.]
MKTICIFILFFVFLSIELSAQVLKKTEIQKIEKQKEKSSLEADLLKDSWINSLSIESDYTKNKTINTKTITKKAYLNFNQDIFRSGGIYYTIKKAKIQKKLSFENYTNLLSNQKTEALKLVLSIRKIDLQIKKQDYLIKNKTIEIDKKQEEYLNGTVNIEDLDTAVIEKNDVENQIEDLKIAKFNLIKELKNYSSLSYEKINPIELKIVSLDDFLENNKELIINKLNSSISKYEKNITSSKYLPKISIFSQIGYEEGNEFARHDDFYNYGLKISIPLDYNMNKNMEISKLNYRLSKINESLEKEKKINQYESVFQSLRHINKKIENGKLTIKKYESIYSLTKDFVEGLIKTKEDLKIIENRLYSSRLDIDILNIDKQLLIYEINKY